MGYLLRAFQANFMTLTQARALYGIRKWRELTAPQSSALAWACGAPGFWLQRRLMLRSMAHHNRFTYLEHEFRQQVIDSNMSAKICPECVREFNFCRSAWILQGITACPAHGTILIDRCGYCQRTISWRRPGLDVCGCGRFLRRQNGDGRAPKLTRSALEWPAWLSLRLEGRIAHASLRSRVPAFLDYLTIDSATALVIAFGMVADPDEHVNTTKANICGVAGLNESISRGLDRLTQIGPAFRGIRRLSRLIHTPALERLRRQGVSKKDRACASLFLTYLGSRNSTRSVLNDDGQMEMFL